jgi:hypothetical protein
MSRMKLMAGLSILVGNLAMAGEPPPSHEGWTSLFNGKNLEGWYTYLEHSGKNNDPKRIFSVERGMVHLYGIPPSSDPEEFGYLATVRDFSHCRIRVEFKWGKSRFAPRAYSKRDSGLIYFKVGADNFLARSLQLQIAETDVGDLWMNGGAAATTSLDSENPSAVQGQAWLYSPGLRVYTEGFVPHRQEGGRVIKSDDMEDRRGWNTLELVLDGDRATHIVNGVTVLRVWNVRQPAPEDASKSIPLDSGQLLLEAEGAEVWFRNIEMQPLPPRDASKTAGAPSGPLSLKSTFGQLLDDPRSSPVLGILLNEDVLRNPVIDELRELSGSDALSNIVRLADEQLQALDHTLMTVSGHSNSE